MSLEPFHVTEALDSAGVKTCQLSIVRQPMTPQQCAHTLFNGGKSRVMLGWRGLLSCGGSAVAASFSSTTTLVGCRGTAPGEGRLDSLPGCTRAGRAPGPALKAPGRHTLGLWSFNIAVTPDAGSIMKTARGRCQHMCGGHHLYLTKVTQVGSGSGLDKVAYGMLIA